MALKKPAKAAAPAKAAKAPAKTAKATAAAPKAAAAAKGAPAPATVTLKHVAAQLAETHDMQKKHAETVLADMVGLVVEHLEKGDRIRFGGLGILQVRERAARMGRNPATGESIQIKASKKIAFRPAKELKDRLV